MTGNPVAPPQDSGGTAALEHIVIGTGCFWGTEKGFWRMPGVSATSVGYCAGRTKNPTYKEVCSGQTGHNEVVRVIWDPEVVSLADILRQFWESHDPTQGMGQGNDRGTQYRSGIYPTTDFQKAIAEQSRAERRTKPSWTKRLEGAKKSPRKSQTPAQTNFITPKITISNIWQSPARTITARHSRSKCPCLRCRRGRCPYRLR